MGGSSKTQLEQDLEAGPFDDEQDLEKDNDKQVPELRFSTMELIRFSCSIGAYRILRLSLELFLVMRIDELDFAVSQAGTVFLLYLMASITAGLFFLWQPSIFFGSAVRGTAFVVLGVSFMFGGFLGMFHVQSFAAITALAMVSGIGSASWNINLQAMTNLAFPKDQLGSAAMMRTLLESIGFLIPSICLAIVMSTGRDSSVVQVSATILGFLGVAFSLISADQVIRSAAFIQPNNTETPKEGLARDIWNVIRTYFGTSIVRNFMLNTILLAVANILMGTLSLITELYFGLEPEWLWLAAIAFPIGGMASIASQMLRKVKKNGKDIVHTGLWNFSFLFAVCILLGIFAFPPTQQDAAKGLLFLFGFLAGAIYAVTFSASVALWLVKLKGHDADFVSRACVVDNLGVQAIIALVFQLQTLLVDTVTQSNSTVTASALVLFAPLLLLIIVCHLLAHGLPYAKDDIFGWPFPEPFGALLKATLFVLDLLGLSSEKNVLLFSSFGDYRTGFLNAHLGNSKVQDGPAVPANATLTPEGLRGHLAAFDELKTQEEWWESDCRLCSLLLNNEDALEKRLQLIERATSKIWVMTWLIEHSTVGEQVADALIKRSKEGLDVKVMVDAITLYYLRQKLLLRGINDMATLSRLVDAGVTVKMLDRVHEEVNPPYVVGSHRKIMIVDDCWVLTGGRNITTEYFTTSDFHYHDADVLLYGSFATTTSALFKNLWVEARDVSMIFEEEGYPKQNLESEVPATERSDIMDTDYEPKQSKRSLLQSQRSIQSSMSRLLTESSYFTAGLLDEDEELPNEAEKHTLDCIGESTEIDVEKIDWGPLSKMKMGHSEVSVRRSSFFKRSLPLELRGEDITLFQLDHKAGRIDGQDIIYSTLLFLIETSQEKIDLILGYFQLFPGLDAAISRAIQRGVKVRLVTNSDATNGISFFNPLFRAALERVIELGVEVYVTAADPTKEVDFCLHYKMAVFDGRAAFLGSWNCLGTSVFYDSDFHTVMFDAEGSDMFDPIDQLVDDSVAEGRLVRMETIPEGSFKVPFVFQLLASRNGLAQMKRGY
ncbi:Cardiolipin synthase 1 [Seminavis robusta]|uniref:Cardiolipin synthase 1 n=1 Tax=Seminavis robusta TaxID=568900 RepID=A0A9N8H457_9STRA|nr:Cardiolipin synthase 1 [Seminavis robusta]|eukprot:Sro77_g041930.1 Cardiolipin synthase 1 (1058) ;mRNA; r:28293-31466